MTSVKKKKNRQASTNKTETTENATEDWETPPANTTNEREKNRTRGGGPPRMRGRGGCKSFLNHF